MRKYKCVGKGHRKKGTDRYWELEGEMQVTEDDTLAEAESYWRLHCYTTVNQTRSLAHSLLLSHEAKSTLHLFSVPYSHGVTVLAQTAQACIANLRTDF